MPVLHPRRDDTAQPVILATPSTSTPLACWDDTTAITRVVPDGPLPARLNGLALTPWQPPAAMGWESQAVSLVPITRLGEVLHHPNDTPILEALRHA